MQLVLFCRHTTIVVDGNLSSNITHPHSGFHSSVVAWHILWIQEDAFQCIQLGFQLVKITRLLLEGSFQGFVFLLELLDLVGLLWKDGVMRV